jgi:hypothetical protein
VIIIATVYRFICNLHVPTVFVLSNHKEGPKDDCNVSGNICLILCCATIPYGSRYGKRGATTRKCNNWTLWPAAETISGWQVYATALLSALKIFYTNNLENQCPFSYLEVSLLVNTFILFCQRRSPTNTTTIYAFILGFQNCLCACLSILIGVIILMYGKVNLWVDHFLADTSQPFPWILKSKIMYSNSIFICLLFI